MCQIEIRYKKILFQDFLLNKKNKAHKVLHKAINKQILILGDVFLRSFKNIRI